MSKLRFSDGMEFDLFGPLRIEKRSDCYYVVGEGALCPVKDREEGERLIGKKLRIPRNGEDI